MQNPARLFLMVTFPLVAATSAHAQQGRADLRYVAPLPAVVTYTMVDSIVSSVSGMAEMEGFVANGLVRTTVELRMVATDSGVAVNATLKEMKAAMTSPMGDMPFTAPDVPPIDVHISMQGPASETSGGMPNPQSPAGNILAASRLLAGLPRLPGRTLELGETWIDTSRISMPMGDLKAEMFTEVHGKYAADTTVNGKMLNVLHMKSSMKMKMTGSMEGNTVNTEMTGTGEERVLWDSALHMPVFRDAAGHTEMSMKTQDGMTVTNKAKVRTLITADY